MKNLTLSQAYEGLILFKTAAGKSHYTIRNYRNSFKKLELYFPDDPPIASITRAQFAAFMIWLQEDYVSEPDGAAPRGRIKLAPKTVHNIYSDLSVLWNWAVSEGIVEKNIVRTVEAPEFNDPVIEPITEEEAKAMIKACERSRTWKNRELTRSRRPTVERDQLIIRILIDTGVRAQELCDIKIGDLNLGQNEIKVGGKGRGSGKKERIVQIGKRTTKSLWRYLTLRLQDAEDDDPLFVTGAIDDPRPMSRDVLRRLVRRIGERAGVSRVYPHRFRHTFAINYLRNQGDIYTLQRLLGHTSLKMVQRYLKIANTDCAEAHRRASPVDNWRL